MATYRYTKWDNGVIIVEGTPVSHDGNMVGFFMNRLSRYIWGIGAAGNSVYNGHGLRVKFQSYYPDGNKRRAFLLTKLYRHCIKNDIRMSDKNFPTKRDLITIVTACEDFDTIIKNLKITDTLPQITKL